MDYRVDKEGNQNKEIMKPLKCQLINFPNESKWPAMGGTLLTLLASQTLPTLDTPSFSTTLQCTYSTANIRGGNVRYVVGLVARYKRATRKLSAVVNMGKHT